MKQEKKQIPPSFNILAKPDLLSFLNVENESFTRIQALNYLINEIKDTTYSFKSDGRVKYVHPGQVYVNQLEIASLWNWHRYSVYMFLKKLKDFGVITTSRDRHSTIIDFHCFDETLITNKQSLQEEAKPDFEESVLAMKPETESTSKQTESPVSQLQSILNLPSVFTESSDGIQLDDQLKELCQQAYNLFVKYFPLLPRPDPYNSKIERSIYYVFILGMRADFDLLRRYFDIVNQDPFRNGTMASLSAGTGNTETIDSIFSCEWMKTLSQK